MTHLSVVPADQAPPAMRAALHEQPIRMRQTRTIDATVCDTRLLAASLRTWLPEFDLVDAAYISDPDSLPALISLAVQNGMDVTACPGLTVQREDDTIEVEPVDWFTLANEEIEGLLGDSPHAAFRALRIASPTSTASSSGERLELTAVDGAALYVASLSLWRRAVAHAAAWRSQPESATILAGLSADAVTFIRHREEEAYTLFVDALHSVWSRLERGTYPMPRTLAETAAIDFCARVALDEVIDEEDEHPIAGSCPDMAEVLTFFDSTTSTPGESLRDNLAHWGLSPLEGFRAADWMLTGDDPTSLTFWTRPLCHDTAWNITP